MNETRRVPPGHYGELAEERRKARLWLRVLRTGAVLVLVIVVARYMGWTERLAYLPERGGVDPPVGAEELTFETSDGLTLHGWFLEADEPQGTILFLHGNAGHLIHHYGNVAFLPHAGFNVLMFDYRGYGRSDPGKLRREFVLRDAHAALDAALADPRVDPQRVAMFAQSLGGVFGLALMEQRAEIRTGAVLSTFSSWQEIAASVLSRGEPGFVARAFGRLVMPAGLDPRDSVSRIVDRPLLLVHGRRDQIVPFHHAEQIIASAGPNVRLRVSDDGDHNYLLDLDPAIKDELIQHFADTLADSSSR